MENTELSIIIVNWNTRDLLAECLQSLISTIHESPYEIWVVDNASTDDSLPMLSKSFPSVNIIANTENVGFARANNQAMEKSTGEFMLLFNSDAVALPGSIQAMLQLAKNNPQIGIVGALLKNTNGSFQASHTPFPTLWQEFLILTGIGRRLFGYYYPSRGPEIEIGPQSVDYIEGACMLVRRQAYQIIGGIDERYFMYAEEVDWCQSMQESDWEVWYQPKAEIIHHGGGSSLGRRTRREGDLYQSRVLFFSKHYGKNRTRALKAMIYTITTIKFMIHNGVRLLSGNKLGRRVISPKELSAKLKGI